MIKQKQKKAKKALVTGGAGFIGSHVVDELINMGYFVVVLDDLSGGFIENINKKAVFIRGSITNHRLVHKIFQEHYFDYVFHLAAYAAEGLSHFIKKFNHENNLMGSVHLINSSIHHDVKCFVFTSSIAVYGKGQLPMVESTAPKPEDSYGIAKYAVELELEATKHMFGMDYIIFRPHNVYGERQNIGDKYRNVLGIFINNTMQGKPLHVFGDGKQKRAFTHVADVAPVIARSVTNKKAYNHIFNIGADKPYTVLDLVKVVSKHMEVEPNLVYLPERNEVKFAYSRHDKLRKFFNHESKIDLTEGVGRMVKWAKKTGVQKSKKFKNIEIRKNLPVSWSKD